MRIFKISLLQRFVVVYSYDLDYSFILLPAYILFCVHHRYPWYVSLPYLR